MPPRQPALLLRERRTPPAPERRLRAQQSALQTRPVARAARACGYSRRVRVTVLGKSPSWQDAGGACSGYLIEDGETALLLDCGNGVFGKLRQRRDYTEVDAVADLPPARRPHPRPRPVRLRAHLRAAPAAGAGAAAGRGPTSPARPRLIAPPGAAETFRRIVGSWGNEDLIDNAFALEEYDADSTVEVGTLRLRFGEVPHFTETYAVELSRRPTAAARFTFSADCRPGEELVEFARDTDLLLVEATLPRPERTGDPRPPDPGGGRRARPPRRREAGGADPHLRRARRGVGARSRARRRSAPRSRSPARAPSTRSEPRSAPALRARPAPRYA